MTDAGSEKTALVGGLEGALRDALTSQGVFEFDTREIEERANLADAVFAVWEDPRAPDGMGWMWLKGDVEGTVLQVIRVRDEKTARMLRDALDESHVMPGQHRQSAGRGWTVSPSRPIAMQLGALFRCVTEQNRQHDLLAEDINKLLERMPGVRCRVHIE